MAVPAAAPGSGPTLGVVLVAAGSGSRFGAVDKVFAPVAGKPLLRYSLELLAGHEAVSCVVVVLGEHTLTQGRALLEALRYRNVTDCLGGATRAESVCAGIAALPAAIEMVAVHDAARPFVSVALFERVLEAARATGAAIPAVPVSDTVHEVGADGLVARTPERASLVGAQTPQVARRAWLERAYAQDGPVTDEAGRLTAAGFPVQIVAGDPANIKITWPDDLLTAEARMAHGQERVT